MAYITITPDNDQPGTAMLNERILPSDMENKLYCTHLLERLSWAVNDAKLPPTHIQRPT